MPDCAAISNYKIDHCVGVVKARNHHFLRIFALDT